MLSIIKPQKFNKLSNSIDKYSPFAEDRLINQSQVANLIKEEKPDEIFTKYNEVISGDFIDVKDINKLFETAISDIDVITEALDASKKKIPGLINEFKAIKDDIDTGVKRAASFLDIYGLYAGILNEDIMAVQETFSSVDDITVDSSALEVNTIEGIVTLPISTIDNIPLSQAQTKIDSVSNGIFRQGHEFHYAFDSSELSYMEYYQENVTDKLTLQFTIALKDISVMNNIIIVPNGFGSNNRFEIEDILGSLNGIDFESVYEASPTLKEIIQRTESDLNYVDYDAGQISDRYSVTFNPRHVKYVKINLSQKHRDAADGLYKIGIKELYLRKIKYANEGTLTINKPIQKDTITSIALHADQTIIDSKAIQTEYFVSVEKDSWLNIEPVESNDNTQEILQFNMPWFSNSVSSSSKPSDAIGIRINMKRNIASQAVENMVFQSVVNSAQFFDYPAKFPHELLLAHAPIEGTVGILAMPYVAIGKAGFNTIELGLGTTANEYTFDLPFDPKGTETVSYGSKTLTKVNSLDILQQGNYSYFLDAANKKIHICLAPKKEPDINNNFHDSWTKRLPVTASGSKAADQEQQAAIDTPFTISFKPEYLTPDRSRKIKLSLKCDGIKENLTIYRTRLKDGIPIIENVKDLVSTGMTIVKLSASPMMDRDIHLTGGYLVPFKDGITEFKKATEYAYSIDTENKLLYLKNPYTQDVSISYFRKAEELLSMSDFSLDKDNQTIIIEEGAYDSIATYRCEYTVAMEVPKGSYEIVGDKIKLTDKTVSEMYLGYSPFRNKRLKVNYQYIEDLRSTIGDMAECISPIVSKITVLYSRI